MNETAEPVEIPDAYEEHRKRVRARMERMPETPTVTITCDYDAAYIAIEALAKAKMASPAADQARERFFRAADAGLTAAVQAAEELRDAA